MVNCGVPGCRSRSEIHSRDGIRFFCIPKLRENVPFQSRRRYERRRSLWLAKIGKLGLLYERDCLRICSLHFVSGKPAAFGDESNSDWCPSVNLECSGINNPRGDVVASAEPESDPPVGMFSIQPGGCHQEENQEHVETGVNQAGYACKSESSVYSEGTSAVDVHLSCDMSKTVEDDWDMVENGCGGGSVKKECLNNSSLANFGADDVVVNSTLLGCASSKCHTLLKEYDDVVNSKSKLRDELTDAEVDKLELTQALSVSLDKCESYAVKCVALETENAALKAKVEQCEARTKQLEEQAQIAEAKIHELEHHLEKETECMLTLEKLQKDESLVKYYTGLPNYGVFNTVLTLVTSQVTDSCRSLEPGKCLLLTLMRLKLGLQIGDIAFRFGISSATACRIFEKWLYYLYEYLEPCVNWPDRETLHKTMPNSFKAEFGKNVAVIIDCFELFCDRPGALDSRAMTMSNYKQHNTVKFLIGITPLGAVSFISQGWGGRVSDKQLTAHSGLYEKLLPHDVILADRGFTISEDVGFYCARVSLPALTRGQAQLSAHDVTDTRRLASLRVHIERVIGLVKNRYRILNTSLHHSFLDVKPGHSVAQIDEVVRVCCALTNLSPGIV